MSRHQREILGPFARQGRPHAGLVMTAARAKARLANETRKPLELVELRRPNRPRRVVPSQDPKEQWD